VQLGIKAFGAVKGLTEETVFKPDNIYEVDMQAEGITDYRAVADYLLREIEKQYPQIQVTWIKVCCQKRIRFQFKILSAEALGYEAPSLSVVAIIPWLSSIFSLIGITILLISIFLIYQAVPWYVWGLIIVGGGLIIFGPSISQALTPTKHRALL